jgi:DNA-binding LacI/PurR family transcriptional regulator
VGFVANLAGNQRARQQNKKVTGPSNSIVRLKDIARKLNISVSTVSRALGKDTCEMVAPELRKKILELAEESNYVPDPAAQLMRKPRVHLITVLLPRETNVFMSEYYGMVLSGIIYAAREGGTETRVALIDPNGGDILEQMQQVAIGAGGLVYMALPLTARQLIQLEDFVRPVVVMGGCLSPHIDISTSRVNTVSIDNFAATHELTTRLLKLGHRRIGLIGGPTTGRDAWERERGFLEAMKKGVHLSTRRQSFTGNSRWRWDGKAGNRLGNARRARLRWSVGMTRSLLACCKPSRTRRSIAPRKSLSWASMIHDGPHAFRRR